MPQTVHLLFSCICLSRVKVSAARLNWACPESHSQEQGDEDSWGERMVISDTSQLRGLPELKLKSSWKPGGLCWSADTWVFPKVVGEIRIGVPKYCGGGFVVSSKECLPLLSMSNNNTSRISSVSCSIYWASAMKPAGNIIFWKKKLKFREVKYHAGIWT